MHIFGCNYTSPAYIVYLERKKKAVKFTDYFCYIVCFVLLVSNHQFCLKILSGKCGEKYSQGFLEGVGRITVNTHDFFPPDKHVNKHAKMYMYVYCFSSAKI